ncbi:MAG: DHHA1 domain-containing protein, partial [Candidatus Eisenbacteria bacterium]
CYPESGGQVTDKGYIGSDTVRGGLVLVYREGEHIVHRVNMALGDREALLAVHAAGECRAEVDAEKRRATERHHTATHLLHAALRTVLGDHVHQAGSLVAPDRLRFDYSHFESPTPLQAARVEQQVNDWVLANVPVSWREMPIAEAKALGAMALFGEKYGERVRMVTVDGVPAGAEWDAIEPSRELCGGTHVRRTGDIGLVVLTEENAVASGVRRIEALCGPAARTWLLDSHGTLSGVMDIMQSPIDKVIENVMKLQAELATLRKAVAASAKLGLEAEFAQLATTATQEANGRWVVARLETAGETNAIRDAADKLRGSLGRGAAVLAIVNEEKFSFLAAVSDDLVAEKKLRADELVRSVAMVTGGSGGGKPHLSLAGGRDMGKLEEALDLARAKLKAALS